MATTTKTAAKAVGNPTATPTATKPQEATAMLRADHKRVSALFAEYEATGSASKKKDLVSRICKELSVHSQLEEEIFYPAVQRALRDTELVPEATVEHATLKDLIAQVEGVAPDGSMFDAKIKVLSEYLKHHVKEEQTEMFPKAKKTSMDLLALGAKMASRKTELLAARSA